MPGAGSEGSRRDEFERQVREVEKHKASVEGSDGDVVEVRNLFYIWYMQQTSSLDHREIGDSLRSFLNVSVSESHPQSVHLRRLKTLPARFPKDYFSPDTFDGRLLKPKKIDSMLEFIRFGWSLSQRKVLEQIGVSTPRFKDFSPSVHKSARYSNAERLLAQGFLKNFDALSNKQDITPIMVRRFLAQTMLRAVSGVEKFITREINKPVPWSLDSNPVGRSKARGGIPSVTPSSLGSGMSSITLPSFKKKAKGSAQPMPPLTLNRPPPPPTLFSSASTQPSTLHQSTTSQRQSSLHGMPSHQRDAAFALLKDAVRSPQDLENARSKLLEILNSPALTREIALNSAGCNKLVKINNMLQQEDPLVTALTSALLDPVQILDFSASTNSTTLVQKLLRASNPPSKRHVIYAGLTRFLQASTFFLVAQDRSAGPVLRLMVELLKLHGIDAGLFREFLTKILSASSQEVSTLASDVVGSYLIQEIFNRAKLPQTDVTPVQIDRLVSKMLHISSASATTCDAINPILLKSLERRLQDMLYGRPGVSPFVLEVCKACIDGLNLARLDDFSISTLAQKFGAADNLHVEAALWIICQHLAAARIPFTPVPTHLTRVSQHRPPGRSSPPSNARIGSPVRDPFLLFED